MFQTGMVKTMKEIVSFCWNLGRDKGGNVMIAADGGKELVQVNIRLEKEVVERMRDEIKARGFNTLTAYVQTLAERFLEVDNQALNEIMTVAYQTGLSPARVLSGMVARWRGYLDSWCDFSGGYNLAEFANPDEAFDYEAVCREIRLELREEFQRETEHIEELAFSRWLLDTIRAQEVLTAQKRATKEKSPTQLSKEEREAWRLELQKIVSKYDYKQNKEWRAMEDGE